MPTIGLSNHRSLLRHGQHDLPQRPFDSNQLPDNQGSAGNRRNIYNSFDSANRLQFVARDIAVATPQPALPSLQRLSGCYPVDSPTNHRRPQQYLQHICRRVGRPVSSLDPLAGYVPNLRPFTAMNFRHYARGVQMIQNFDSLCRLRRSPPDRTPPIRLR